MLAVQVHVVLPGSSKIQGGDTPLIVIFDGCLALVFFSFAKKDDLLNQS